ncbi:hypothetical protein BaRGS_00001082 [Batillaria attramentaria]|uniref:Uncharacterized protein n=1 Tax=Batillaria attramentaria TaxID=370345 RepID=A0ABD0M769_9CAEN
MYTLLHLYPSCQKEEKEQEKITSKGSNKQYLCPIKCENSRSMSTWSATESVLEAWSHESLDDGIMLNTDWPSNSPRTVHSFSPCRRALEQ